VRNLEIRYINSEDNLFKISKIYEESWKYAYKGLIPESFLDSLESGRWVSFLELEDINTIVMTENGEYIGTSSFCASRFEEHQSAGEIVSIYLMPEYMGKGWGRKLINVILEELRKQGYREIFLYVLEENKKAIRFYENSGFMRENDYLEDKIGGKSVREVRYTRTFE